MKILFIIAFLITACIKIQKDENNEKRNKRAKATIRKGKETTYLNYGERQVC
jgi:hypothetical protein